MVDPKDLSYILGNPPFVGKQHQSAGQKADMEAVFNGAQGAGVLDYVSAWYVRAAQLMSANPRIRAAFVSTNSICQGEQAAVLWRELMLQHKVHINFAHRTFRWSSEARGKAAVHCVIVGFGLEDGAAKTLFDYETPESEPHALPVSCINPYLVAAPDVFLDNRKKPLCAVPEIVFGNMPNDGGHLLLSDQEKQVLITNEPGAAKWVRPLLGADEFINGIPRWCLWLKGIAPEQLRALPEVAERVRQVKAYRLASRREATRRLASVPTLFGEIRQPETDYILIPSVSSERREYIPIGLMKPDVVASNLVLMIPGATLYHFGVLTSLMHMAWVRHVCGRLESRYRYSNSLVYNNFPWPEPTNAQREAIERAAKDVLDARVKFPGSTLADLYDPVTMPPDLVKAHADLDRAVDRAYGRTAFASEMERVAFLFERYEALVRPLLPVARPKRGHRGGGRESRTTSRSRQRQTRR